MRISDWSSDVCSSDLAIVALAEIGDKTQLLAMLLATRFRKPVPIIFGILAATLANHALAALLGAQAAAFLDSPIFRYAIGARSEEHTSELQSLMRISYAVFCLKKKKILLSIYTN